MTLTEWIKASVVLLNVAMVLVPICFALIFVDIVRFIFWVVDKIKERKNGK